MNLRVGAVLALVGGLFGRAAEAAPVYNQVACCYSDTGSCTVVPGQITGGLTDTSCSLPTGSAWLLEVETTTPVSNPHFAMQSAEGSGWQGICPAIGESVGFCITATGSPL
jgi:hypothetical protein